jgi:hypothetical protein
MRIEEKVLRKRFGDEDNILSPPAETPSPKTLLKYNYKCIFKYFKNYF